MLFSFAAVLVFVLIGIGFVFITLLIGKLLRPRIYSPEKLSTYECGERPIGSAWFNFNPRFYIIALVFIIFDVEIGLMFPVVMIYKKWVTSGYGLTAFIEIAVFVVVLFVGLVYVWAKGDFSWIKTLKKD